MLICGRMAPTFQLGVLELERPRFHGGQCRHSFSPPQVEEGSSRMIDSCYVLGEVGASLEGFDEGFPGG